MKTVPSDMGEVADIGHHGIILTRITVNDEAIQASLSHLLTNRIPAALAFLKRKLWHLIALFLSRNQSLNVLIAEGIAFFFERRIFPLFITVLFRHVLPLSPAAIYPDALDRFWLCFYPCLSTEHLLDKSALLQFPDKAVFDELIGIGRQGLGVRLGQQTQALPHPFHVGNLFQISISLVRGF